jgi:uncharacterized delta-60 repeat protein
VTTDFHAFDSVRGVALQPNGKIVAVGVAGDDIIHEGGGNPVFALARYSQGGSLDASFGTGGKVTTALPDSEADGIVLQPDGKIVVAGVSGLTFALARYKKNGSLDPGFGAGGKITAPTGSASAVALQSNGKIVAAGGGIARYNPNGSPDLGFGTTGKVATPSFEAHALVIQPDGKIVVAGRVQTGKQDFTKLGIRRYKPDGSLDASFGAGGKVETGFGAVYSEANAVARQSNGMLVVAGDSGNGARFVLARYRKNGSLDPGFGSGGKVLTDFTVCAVPALKGKKESAARRAIVNARCSVGGVSGSGRVVSQKPAPGGWHKVGTKVSFRLG